jgi:site-specific DNA recombinase
MSEQIYSSAVIYLRVSTKEQAQKGGEAEGYSIPAQRAACLRKAEALGIKVIDEFVDAGESAKTSARPQLQAMLSRLEEGGIQYVIVHKIDRLARNRVDDVTINVAIKQAGAKLVSVSENIDESPSGHLMHGIMSSIAEFYSQNLSTEVMKGMNQKVQGGGTPHRAPLGYLNVGVLVNGKEERTVIVDTKTGPLITWAFEQYASGTWSLRQLAKELGRRGLTQRFSADKRYEPISNSVLNTLLTKRYYLGYVTYMGVEYQGKHEALIDQQTFDKVQVVLGNHRTSSERSSKHYQYLAGSVFCARCHSRLGYTLAKGKYPYLFCLSRHAKLSPCDQPYLNLEKVEEAIEELYSSNVFTDTEADELIALVKKEMPGINLKTEKSRHDLQTKIDAIQKERYAWAEQVMAGTVPSDIARQKQAQLATELEQVSSDLKRLDIEADKREKILLQAINKAKRCYKSYIESDPRKRREWNQALWERIELDGANKAPSVHRFERDILFEGLQIVRNNPSNVINIREEVDRILKSRQPNADFLSISSHQIPTKGSNIDFLAGETGLEPATLGFGDRCSTN